jgi:outer membrane protein assembly factor BamB
MVCARFRRGLGIVVTAVAATLLAACGGSGGTPRTHLSTAARAPAGIPGVGTLPSLPSAWPAAGRDARHSSASDAVGPQSPAVRWKRDLGGRLTPGPVIGSDGSVLVATNSGILYALDPATGASRWRFDGGAPFGSDLSTSAAVISGGTVLWPGPGAALFALSPTGRLLWKQSFVGQVLSPAVAGLDRVYVADVAGHLTALTVAGAAHSTLWSIRVGHDVDYASPTVGPDGTVYTASGNSLVAVHDTGSSGSIVWTFTSTALVEVSNAVSPDGTAYFGDNMGRLHVVDSRTGGGGHTIAPLGAGKEKIWTSAASDARGNFYWGTTEGNVYGYRRDGSRLFHLPTGSPIDGYPAIGGDGSLYIGTTGGILYAIGGSAVRPAPG